VGVVCDASRSDLRNGAGPAYFSPRGHAGGNQRKFRLLVSDRERHKPTLLPSIHTLLIAALSRARRMNWANRFLPQTLSRMASHYSTPSPPLC
jgi:hypothetical protein